MTPADLPAEFEAAYGVFMRAYLARLHEAANGRTKDAQRLCGRSRWWIYSMCRQHGYRWVHRYSEEWDAVRRRDWALKKGRQPRDCYVPVLTDPPGTLDALLAAAGSGAGGAPAAADATAGTPDAGSDRAESRTFSAR